jgi:hypothetical protein
MRKLLAIALLACLPGIADAQTSSFFSQTTTTQQQVQTAPPVVVDATPTYFATGYTGCGVGANFAFRAAYSPFFSSRFVGYGGYGGAFIGGTRFVGGARFGGAFIGSGGLAIAGGRRASFSQIVGPFGGSITNIRVR